MPLPAPPLLISHAAAARNSSHHAAAALHATPPLLPASPRRSCRFSSHGAARRSSPQLPLLPSWQARAVGGFSSPLRQARAAASPPRPVGARLGMGSPSGTRSPRGGGCGKNLSPQAGTGTMGPGSGRAAALPGPIAQSASDSQHDLEMVVKKYTRGKPVNVKRLPDKKLRGNLTVKENLYGQSAKAAAKADKWLKPTEDGGLEPEGLEKTYRFQQTDILKDVPLSSSRNAFDMNLPVLGPYTLEYTSNGRYMLVAGRKGHLALMDMLHLDLIKEFQVRETVRDVAFLHTEDMYAVAQKKYTYVYNRHGTEIHCLKEHGKALKLQFLNKQFLLASINSFGQLHYQDVSTGEMTANYRTGPARADVMRVNPYNAVIGLGHSDGKVTMWKPTSVKPLVTMLCHSGSVTAVAFDKGGHLMATAGIDRKIKIWDLRKYEVVKSYADRAQSLDFSQKGLLACSNGSLVEIYKDFGGHDYKLYMKHKIAKGYEVGKVSFRPYEDILGMGHSMGLTSIIVPGSGEPNFDTFVDNPYETTKQKREKEVHALLDKLPPETIMLNPNMIATVRPPKKEKKTKKKIEEEMEEAIESAKKTEMKKKTKGRSKPSKRAKKKEEEVFRAKRPFLDQYKENDGRPDKKQRVGEVELPKALQRFAKKT